MEVSLQSYFSKWAFFVKVNSLSLSLFPFSSQDRGLPFVDFLAIRHFRVLPHDVDDPTGWVERLMHWEVHGRVPGVNVEAAGGRGRFGRRGGLSRRRGRQFGLNFRFCPLAASAEETCQAGGQGLPLWICGGSRISRIRIDRISCYLESVGPDLVKYLTNI